MSPQELSLQLPLYLLAYYPQISWAIRPVAVESDNANYLDETFFFMRVSSLLVPFPPSMILSAGLSLFFLFDASYNLTPVKRLAPPLPETLSANGTSDAGFIVLFVTCALTPNSFRSL